MFYYIITIHNKEDMIERVLDGVIKSTTTGKIICVLDGCSDGTEKIIDSYKSNIPIYKIHLPDVHELISLNRAFEYVNNMSPSDEDYMILLQDDVILDEPNMESMISDIYKSHKNLAYLSFRLGCSTALSSNGILHEYDFIESEFGHWKQLNLNHFYELPHGEFRYTELSLKSPTCIPVGILKKVGPFDEALAPFGHDDLDLCIRLNKLGYKNGIYSIKFASKLDWGGTREDKNQDKPYHKHYNNIVARNKIYLSQKHSDYFKQRHTMSSLLDIEFDTAVLNWKNTPSANDSIYTSFHNKTKSIDFLNNHRNYIDRTRSGFGEFPFHYMWLLLLNQMPSKFRFMEIGVYKGAVLSLVKLISDKMGKVPEIYGITPLNTSGDKYLPQYDNENYLECIGKVFADNNLDVSTTCIIEGYSTDESIKQSMLQEPPFDIIYVDGSHNYEDVINDILLSDKILNTGGYMVFDDASSSLNMGKAASFNGHSDVARAITDTIEKNPNYTHLFACGHNRIFKKIK